MLAARLDYTFVDSGKIYRLIAAEVLANGIDPTSQQAVTDLAYSIPIEVQLLPQTHRPEIIINGHELSQLNLHNPEINRSVPIVAAFGEVRALVRKIQRQVAEPGGVVLAGRDIGTVVLPQADLKIFLSVSLQERVNRRYNSLRHVTDLTPQNVQDDLERRDELDSTRDESPMRPALDAIIVRTDAMEPNEVVEHILGLFASLDR